MKIIDAHHHFWDPKINYHPWLRDEPMIPFRYGDYSAIRCRFMPEDYDKVTAAWEVEATITMEGEWNPEDPTGEALWLQELFANTGRPAAHVAQIWLDRHDLDAVLACYDQLPIVRSVRHKPYAYASPNHSQGGMSETAFQKGFAKLAQHGLAFDLQTPWWHLHEVPKLLKGSEDTLIILNHAGLPADRSPEGITGWRKAVSDFARLPNTMVKISGLGISGRPWTLENNRDIILTLIDLFGCERAMFASNFPVDGLCGSFDTIYGGFDLVTRDFTDTERASLFAETAKRAYRLLPGKS